MPITLDSVFSNISEEDDITCLTLIMTCLTLFCDIMCIHLGMSIEHDFIWSTSYRVLGCVWTFHLVAH